MSSLRHFDEFPTGAAGWPNELSRRRFLKLMGASVALAGATGCTRQAAERIVPYVRQPEEVIPGKPLYYATALTLGGYARGVLVETHEGRPTKIEGNPLHPASLGASDVFMQAELLTLYDPERSPAVLHQRQISTWDLFLAELTAAAQKWKTSRGSGLRLLTRRETSPTLLDQIDRLLKKYPAAKWHEYEPLASDRPAARYHFDRAEVVVSLGADFLSDPDYARDFAARRRPNESMNRLYVAESTPSLTGAVADHRLIMRPDEIEPFAQRLVSGAGEIAKDLRSAAGKGVVVAGDSESLTLHRLVHALNESLGSNGVTVDYTDERSNSARTLVELVADMREGKVETLCIIGGNPVYDAPADFEFATILKTFPPSFILDCIGTKRPTFVAGTFPKRTRSKVGATPAPGTERRRSCSR